LDSNYENESKFYDRYCLSYESEKAFNLYSELQNKAGSFPCFRDNLDISTMQHHNLLT